MNLRLPLILGLFGRKRQSLRSRIAHNLQRSLNLALLKILNQVLGLKNHEARFLRFGDQGAL
jgi:hypothetical protein